MLTADERRALEAIRFNWAEVPDDVWRTSEFHVEGLHRATTQALLDGMAEANDSVEASPIGVAVQGQRGSGKTHLLGWVRERIQQEGGYFFLVGLLDAKSFWDSVLESMLDSLSREADGESQLRMFLRRLSSQVGMRRVVRRELFGGAPLTKEALDAFVEALRRYDGRVGLDAQDTLRALVLRASNDLHAQDLGHMYLASEPEEEPGERARWGMRRARKSQQEIVRDVSRLLALTGPSVIAVDQIDTLIAQSSLSTKGTAPGPVRPEALIVEQIAGGLMALREYTRRTLTVLSCLPASWVLIETVATDTVRDRFRQAVPLRTIPSAKIGRELIEKRLAARFRTIGFRPPYPTWPVEPSAFENAPGFTARQLLMRIDEHVRACLVVGEVTELEHLATPLVPQSTAPPVPPASPAPGGVARATAALDARFAELRDAAGVAPALDPRTEDAVMPALLSAGLAAWIAEQGEAGREFGQDAPPSAKPSLHARLRRSLDETTEDEAHWAFRAIAAQHPIAVLSRLRTASVAAGLDAQVPRRRLFVLRNAAWSGGPRTREAVAAFERAGGRTLPVDEEDLKSLAALRDMLAENRPDLPAWLAARRPTGEIKLLNEALADVWTVPDEGVGEPAAPTMNPQVSGVAPECPDAGPAPVAEAGGGGEAGTGDEPAPLPPPALENTGAAQEGHAITIGATLTHGEPVTVDLEALRRHTVIFAGSGSGKTVLIRRLVEECALHGVSAIVLDPNNDLARLGDPWPQDPSPWGPGDAARAREYLDATDVVIWTPRREAGRPLTFPPLPDFSGVAEDPDEFAEAVDAAVESLAPRAKLVGTTNRVHQGLAVLREGLRYYARRGPTRLSGLIEVLASLPEGVSGLRNAGKLAADIAENLTAATVNDPLFGDAGTAVDPGVLLTPRSGKRARISVISLAGLPSDGQRQGFVNQVQMALFSWIRRNPAGNRPLGGLFVMDEAQTFAPSGAMTACTHSTLALASQARKYGLGLVFATQAPKGLHNRIPGNAATQFFGLLNAPVQIEAAKELARAKGGGVADVGHLSTGEFYAALPGEGFRKVRTPLCLSHHPASALTADEVTARARRSLERESSWA